MTTLYFIGFLLFLKKKIFYNVRTKRDHETDVLWKLCTNYIPNSLSFVSLDKFDFSSKTMYPNVRTIILALHCSRFKKDNI